MVRAAVVLFLVSTAAAQDEQRPVYKSRHAVINVHRHCDLPTEEAVQAEFAVMDRVGVRAAVILLMGKEGTTRGRLREWLDLRNKHPDRLIVFGSVDFDRIKEPSFFEDTVRELETQAALGIQGVKLWKDLGMTIRDGSGALLKADDPRLDPFWARCGELGLPVLYHIADPKEYWYPLGYTSFHYGTRSDKDRIEAPPWEELMRQRDAVLKKHPRTTVIGAHMGNQCFELDKLAEALDKYPNFHVECAARIRILGRFNPQAVRDFFTRYQDRVMFGTDMNVLQGVDTAKPEAVRAWQDKAARFYGRYLEYFETGRTDLVEPYGWGREWLRLAGANLPDEVLAKFTHRNAERHIPGLRSK
jgi:uncharacterized protein